MDLKMYKELYQQISTFHTFLNQVFPFALNNNSKPSISIKQGLELPTRRLKIGDKITFRIQYLTYNGIVIDSNEEDVEDEEKYQIYYLNGKKKWHSFRGIAVWKRGHLKWDREAFRVKCPYDLRPSTYMRKSPHADDNSHQTDDEDNVLDDDSQVSSDSEWLPSEEDDNDD